MSNESHPKFKELNSRLESCIAHFDAEASKHKRLFRLLRYGVFGLTALSTILAGMSAADIWDHWIKIILVAVTSATSLLASIEGLRKPADLWLNERSVCHGLHDLKREVDYLATGTIDEKTLDECFRRMQTLLSDGSIRWKQQLQPGADKGNRSSSE